MSFPIFLASDSYVPKTIIDRFNNVTALMMENGINTFIQSFTEFCIRTAANVIERYENDDEFQPVTFLEFQYVMYIFLSVSVFSVVIHVCEIMWYRIRALRVKLQSNK